MLALTPDPTPRDLAIYIHWPFCQKICPYCDFNVARARNVDESAWEKAYLRELATLHTLIPNATIPSIFFGGGTPSLMPPPLVEKVIRHIAITWRLDPSAEITLEANPTDAEVARFQGFAEAGVNRLSLGLQALNDHDLKKLGRWHSADDGLHALSIAQKAFTNVSCDLIYARPDQSVVAWKKELTQLLRLTPQHVSLYQLTIEPHTAFHNAMKRGTLLPPNEELTAALFDISQEICEEHGMPAYEISNHAAERYQSKHNLAYWRYQDYAGLGPGAHGRLTLGGKKYSTLNILKHADWMNQVTTEGQGCASIERLSLSAQAMEMMLMGLRLCEGFDLMRYEELVDMPLLHERVMELCEQDLLSHKNNRVSATVRGRRVLNSVLEQLFV